MHKAQLRLTGMSIVIKQSKTWWWRCESQMITIVIVAHPTGSMNVCSNFHGNPVKIRGITEVLWWPWRRAQNTAPQNELIQSEILKEWLRRHKQEEKTPDIWQIHIASWTHLIAPPLLSIITSVRLKTLWGPNWSVYNNYHAWLNNGFNTLFLFAVPHAFISRISFIILNS